MIYRKHSAIPSAYVLLRNDVSSYFDNLIRYDDLKDYVSRIWVVVEERYKQLRTELLCICQRKRFVVHKSGKLLNNLISQSEVIKHELQKIPLSTSLSPTIKKLE